MTRDDVLDVMLRVEATWTNSKPMTSEKLDVWRTRILPLDFAAVIETIDTYPVQLWRPDVMEFLETHHARMQRARQALADAADETSKHDWRPATKFEREFASGEIAKAREMLVKGHSA